MAPQLKISSSVIERLNNVDYACTGRLYGVVYENTLMVLTFTVDAKNGSDETDTSHIYLQLNMPAEIDLCGVLSIGGSEQAILYALKEIDVTDNPLLLKCGIRGTELQSYFYIHQKLEKAGSLEVLNELDIWQQFAYIRLEASFPIVTRKDGLLEAIQEARKNIASGKVGFYLPKNNVYLLGEEIDTKDSSLEFLQVPSASLYEGIGHTKNILKRIPEIVDAISADMFIISTKDGVLEEGIRCAPVLQHVKQSFECLDCHLKIDALSLVSRNIGMAQLYAVLVESVCRNLKLTEQTLSNQLAKDGAVFKLPESIHFKPRGCGHLFTINYPAGFSDADMYQYRRSLHTALALDMTKPCFRKGNALKFRNDVDLNAPLLNPHEAIQNSGVAGGKPSLVDGLYSYHHYMQDHFDDNGWGCAYRSLQTIISWYILHGYTEKSIPSHREIQRILVDIGDKPSSFIGSKQWIGSTEVGFVLETLLGVTIKVLCASTGQEMSSLASSLAYHFQTQGTPVMIGGGVLAHTILGIDYNENSGDVKFLILDPHYTGGENLTTIITKGWCGWKNQDFWKKDAFYNMCLPQRPICI
ncbi:ufm1-specific protease 2 [Diprion similis]|uniref:ufm1-specific protease 2 n=1 Tax=Diprion similis TaxID=362088 RepID=UPI001EF7884B|nr:ufm1-specific protease 2 [Diprion similis]